MFRRGKDWIEARLSPRTRHILLSSVAAAAAVGALSGCVTTERERFFSARAVIIPASQGDGSVSFAIWPAGPDASEFAAANPDPSFRTDQ